MGTFAIELIPAAWLQKAPGDFSNLRFGKEGLGCSFWGFGCRAGFAGLFAGHTGLSGFVTHRGAQYP